MALTTEAGRFQQFLQSHIYPKLVDPDTASGQTFKEVERELKRRATGYRKAPPFDQQELGRKLEQLHEALHEALQRANPQSAKQLKEIDFGFRQHAIVRNAVGQARQNNGVFTPTQFADAVYAGDSSAHHNRYNAGRALMQDLSRAGTNVLGKEIPPTAEIARTVLGTLGLVGEGAAAFTGHFTPAVLSGLAGAGASTLYTPPVMKGLAALFAKRPAWAQGAAQGLQNAAPLTSWAIAPNVYSRPQ